MALRGVADPTQLIHHSDRGIRYCSGPCRKVFRAHGVRISMAAAGNAYENAIPERVNGILKGEFYLGGMSEYFTQAHHATVQAIGTHNTIRPHTSIGYVHPA